MARRATPLTKGRTPTKDTAPSEAKAPRRAKKPPTEKSVPDASFAGGEKIANVADSGLSEPAKLRRVRKPRLIELAAETLAADDDRTEEIAAPTTDARLTESDEMPGAPAEYTGTPTASAAAWWDANTGTATFDWPAIEHVAATSGPNQAMAKLLLAARAEGGKLPLATLIRPRRRRHAAGR